jgi:hypothetical protein
MDVKTAKSLQYHEWLHHKTQSQGRSECLRVRVNGAPQTWKSRPDEVRVPIVWGMRDYGQLREWELGDWERESDCARCHSS